MMRKIARSIAVILFLVSALGSKAQSPVEINLAGEWAYRLDSLDQGEAGHWFDHPLSGRLHLPGSLTTNGIGDDITLHTPWTGDIVDSSFFHDAQYAPYRRPGHIKVPFWLQPEKYYKGAAWYQKAVTIPAAWKGHLVELFIERAHWETTVWVDGRPAGRQNSLGTPHTYFLSELLTPGTHTISIRVDNRVKDFNVGPNSHSISDHTQSNWNGMIGKLCLQARSLLHIASADLFPSVQDKKVRVSVAIVNPGHLSGKALLQLQATGLPPLKKEIVLEGDSTTVEVDYPMGAHPRLWDEFAPNLYKMQIDLRGPRGENDRWQEQFGMRTFSTEGTHFTINGRLTFLRGTLECAIFPKTGYPPTDLASWMHIFRVCRSYGLNHIRFHSWCPPEAAFDAADRSGFYLHVECSSWANQGATIGDGRPLDNYLYDESERMVKAYGNHPSFCMMAYGNEPAGSHLETFLGGFVEYWKKKDNRRLYTTAAGWPVIPESDYNSTPAPRIQRWGEGLKSIINTYPPREDYDWRDIISKWEHPTVSHEIGQWCVYPDLKEIDKYTGVLKAKNFEIFRDCLRQNGMVGLADSFLLASGKLQTLCYKADIEAALRTPGFGGFQLLDLHDFPGQGTALVGVLNPFWEDKGYVTGAEYSRFCNALVPLVRWPRFVYLNDDSLELAVEAANFGPVALSGVIPRWAISNADGAVVRQGQLPATAIALGNGQSIGVIRESLGWVKGPGRFRLTVSIGARSNSWDFFVYPAKQAALQSDVYTCSTLDDKALAILKRGGKVLLSLARGSIRKGMGAEAQAGFSSIFWNTAWTHGQAPHTLGILCDPRHGALAAFPTQYYSNWEWCDALTHGGPIRLDQISAGLRPIVRVIDDWVTAHPLALLFECRIGNGRLLVSGVDLLTGAESRPEARQLKYSLLRYMNSSDFRPEQVVPLERIVGIYEERKE